MELVKKGAEADIYLTKMFDQEVIIKRRISKNYRNKQIDFKIRNSRTIHESQLLNQAKRSSVPTPTIRLVNRQNSEIIMDYVKGVRLRDLLHSKNIKKAALLCYRLGVYIGRLHKHGIIHGDLTTSNIIMDSNERMVFIDFGLGFYSNTIEAQGVDLHLLKQVFESFHYVISKECFNSVMKGYGKIIGNNKTIQVLNKIKEIEGRGRYVSPESRYFGKKRKSLQER